jgi:hypothetical protein
MADSPGFVRRLGSVLLIAGTVLGLYNVYADNTEVRVLAERTACGERDCTARVTRESRSPISQSFTYQTELTEKGRPRRQASVDVECQRAYYLLGEYSCKAQGVIPP